MGKHTIKGAGGQKPLKYGEETVTVFGRRVPKSKEKLYRKLYKQKCDPIINEILKSWEVKKPKGKQS
jgi:hypothetical protein